MKWPKSRRPKQTRAVIRATMAPGDNLGGGTLNCYAKRDIWQRWYTVNPVLRRGEIGVTLHPQFPNGVEFMVIGDGVTPWKELRRYHAS